jgi:hypothetical protein
MKCYKGPQTCMDIEFKSLYRAGSLKTVAEEISKLKLY